MSKPKKFSDGSKLIPNDNPMMRCVIVPVSASVLDIDQQTANLHKALGFRSQRSRDAYLNSRKPSDDWRETFAKWGYVPCVE